MKIFSVSGRVHSHPVFRHAGLHAVGLWVIAGAYSAASDMPGFVPRSYIEEIGEEDAADRLALVGLWDSVDGGWIFADVDFEQHYRISRRHREPIDASLRLAVLERDGNKCVQCGTVDDLCMDHIWPWSRGGLDTYENLQTLCRSCNSRKGARINGDGYSGVHHRSR